MLKSYPKEKIIFSLLLLFISSIGLSQDGNDERLEEYYEQYPEADTDGDMIVSQDEHTKHQAKLYRDTILKTLEGKITFHGDMEYAKVEEKSLTLDLYLPIEIDPDNKPYLVVWVHGGGWRTGSKDQCLLAWMATHNFAVASVEFRSVGETPFPANVHDIKGAIRWLRKNAQQYNYQEKNVGIGGSSSGGHLASLVGMSGDVLDLEGDVGGNLDYSSRVQAAFDVAGVIDILLWRDPPGVITSALGILDRQADNVPHLVALSNPITHLSNDDPPFLIFHGLNDNVVDVAQAEFFYDTLQQANIESSLHILDVGHLSPLFFNGERADTIISFFTKALNTELTTAINEVLPTNPFSLTIHPNPMTRSTEFIFELENPTEVTIQIYKLGGELYEQVIPHQRMKKGENKVTYTPRNIEKGLFYVILKTAQQETVEKMVIN